LIDDDVNMKKLKLEKSATATKLDDLSRAFFIKNPAFLFMGIMIILIATILLSFSKLNQFENAVRLVRHTNVVKEKLSELLSNLKDAETGQRGYLLTQDRSFLEPYIKTDSINNDLIIELDSLTKDNLIQQKNLFNLTRLVNERLIILKRNLSLVSNNTTNSNNLNALMEGSNKMNQVRKQVSVMIHLQEELLQQRTVKKNKLASITPLFILLIFLLSVFALALFFTRWRRETQLRISAQQKAIKITETSENRIKSILKEMPSGFCILKEPNHIFEFANNAFFELVGTQDIIGKSVSQVFSDSESKGFIDLLDNVYKTGETFFDAETPFTLRQSFGNKQYIDFSYQSFKDIDGDMEGILVFAYNVTEKVIARKVIEENEQELQKTAAYLKLATDSAHVGIWSFDLKTQILAWSQLHKEMWGYDDEHRQDLAYEDWFQIILPGDKEKVGKNVEEARVNHITYDVDYCINRKNDGALRCIRSVGKYYYNDKGEAEVLTGISIDITDQKESEEKIKEDRKLFETTLQNVSSAIYHFDKTGKILYLNEIAANQIGYATIEEVHAEKDVFQLRKKAYESFTILNEQGDPMSLDQGSTALTFKTGKPAEVVSQLIHKKSGASVWLLSKASPFYDDNGELIKVIATSTDITLQKTSEQALRQSEEHFRTFANSMQNMAWIANADGWIYWYNQRWYDFTGSTLEEMEGWGWQKVHHPDHTERIKFTLESLKKDKEFELTFPLRRHDGKYRWFLTHVYPLKDVNGNVERWIGTNTDITEQKNFSEELENKVKERTLELSERNTFIETLVDSSIDFIITFDKDLRYLSVNKAAKPIFDEHFPDGVIGKAMDEVIPNVKQSDVYANAQAALQGNTISQKGYKSFYKNKYYDVDFVPLRNENEMYGIMTISRDVTENVLAAQEMKTKNIALQNANNELNSFTYIASHDLQEPLRKIQMFTQLITDEETLSEKSQYYFERIKSASERMQSLIISLLDFSRTDITQLNIVSCDLNAIVEESKDDLHLKIIESQAVVEYENLPTIDASRSQLTHLFTNIIENAIKYSKSQIQPHIKISAIRIEGKNIEHPAASDKEYHAIKFADNGIGFEKEYAVKIFELFQRLHGRNEYLGTGIGLAIVKKIATNHDGFIVAEGELNKGATFTVYIPI